MKRIGIYLERKPDSGGAYQYCLAMLKALSQFPKEQYEIVAYIMYEEWRSVTEKLGITTIYAQKSMLEKIIYHFVEVVFPVSLCRKICPHLHPVSRKMRQQRIDYCIYPCADKISFMLDTPAIVSVFDLMHRYLNEFPEISKPSIYKSRERSYINIAHYAEMILVDSSVGKKQMEECYDKDGNLGEKIYPLPFIAPSYIYDNENKSCKLLQEIPDRYIFYPAQFWKHKNHKNLLKAISKLREEGIEVTLVCSGTNKNGYNEVIQLIEELSLTPQVKILGYVSNEEMISLYKNAVALVMPTYGGPTNIPQLEAFALGCPVATSRIFGIPEQVGDAALLFDPSDVEEIAACIKKLWLDESERKRLIEKGYQKSNAWGPVQFRDKLLEYIKQLP